MLNKDVDILFSHGHGANNRILRADWVRFGMEFIGEVFDDIDFNLIEDYQDARFLINVKVRLFLADTIWIVDFLKSDSKILSLDGFDIEVVNNAKRISFPLLEKFNLAVVPELRFKKRDQGIPTFGARVSVGYVGNVGVTI